MEYFLAIIGGGPAGYTAAEKASKAGKQVILFEQNALGGTCLNVGCIPTKTLLYSAKQYYNATHADKYGVKAENVSFDYAKIAQRKQKVVRKLVAGIKAKLNNEFCTVINGAASVVSRTDDKVVIACGEEQYTAENLLICTGSNNFVPPIPGVKDNPCVWDSTLALDTKELPQSIVIVGGGVIGMEFATLYHELGVPVTVIEAMPTILPNLDQEVVAILREKYEKSGVKILTDTKVLSLEGNLVKTSNGDYEADKVLISVGRRANLQGLEALTDLEFERGIKVDDFMKTNLANVYAAGDVTGKIMLAHVASRQAEVAVGRMLKQIPVQRIAYNAIPSVVYTNPEIASVGITEDVMDCEIRRLPMTFSGRFVAENEGETGLCKMLIDKKSQSVLGVHMIGNPCSEFVAAASFAVRMGYTVAEFQQVVFPHPTVSEILKEIL
ncbi:MAG: dihydrolipoyl dehydrogenase [Paludibacteraceae bacterium]|nr:dihydrolipoyl dehydrogenase [Candidatus Colicola coprequi]MCQ2333991.1 dihydrolipoyl dehydrogenase [Paludibacteraceae bacterium]